jgi:SAM-dependent methyltransferase
MADPTTREPHRNPLKRLMETTWQVAQPLADTLAETPAGARICDVGAGGRRVRPDAVCVDIAAGPNVDVVADSHELPLEDAGFDLVICTGTLNLCRDPAKVLSELQRILRPGGRVHLEVGMFQPYNPEPEDYWRWTLPGLRLLHARAGFQEVRSGAHIGPMSALATSGAYLAGRVFEGPSPVMKAARGVSHLMFGPLKYLDALLGADRLARTPFAYGIYYVGRKAG